MPAPHEHRIRVRYAETDQMGVVYHAHYLVFIEEARTRMLAELGFPYDELERSGCGLVVRKAELRYRSAAVYGDVLRVRTRVERVGGASLRLAYEIVRDPDSRLVATAMTELAAVDLAAQRRPRALPDGVRAALSASIPAG